MHRLTILSLLTAISACSTPTPEAPVAPPAPVAAATTEASPPPAAEVALVAWTAPDPATIPAGPDGDLIRRGKQLATATPKELPDHVGGAIACSNCHIGAGTTPGAFPWVGVTHRYPKYRARSATTEDLPRRINDCFERSLNGKALDPAGDDMKAMVAYMTWLSKDVAPDAKLAGLGLTELKAELPADTTRGEAVYQARCQVCHQADGQGMTLPDGTVAFPPLWGDRSFNIGAGMARQNTAASFVYEVMPLGQGHTLTAQEAHDVAAYFITRPRPDFAGKANDWPQGGKPVDARY